ncbi:MAG: arylsulfatase [Planctomycetota bacterium]
MIKRSLNVGFFKAASRWLVLFVLIGWGFSLVAADRPNVVVILTDDQGWGDLSLNGNTNLSTPNIDSLAKDGASFDRFYVCAVCSPTRAEFLTGRYHARSGVYSTSAGGERMDLDEVTIADTFKAAGYTTGAFGKWHNGMQYPYHPNGRGFDEYYGFCSGHWGDYFSPPLEHNGQIVRGEGFVIDDFTSKAMAFIESSVQKKQPFFAYLPYNTPHSPMQVPHEYWERFKDKELGLRHRDAKKEDIVHTRAALAMCENIDWNVGRLLKMLDALGIADDTIVVYFHDNGPNGSRWNGGMKGRKGSTDEGGLRTAMLMRWPGHIMAGKEIKPIASALDLLPTLADLAGIEHVGKKRLDGDSLKPLLLEDNPEWKNRILVSNWKDKVSVRNQRYRLGTEGGLYDIQKDPGQYKNISGDKPEIRARLQKVMDRFKANVLPGYGEDDRPFVIAHPDYKYTQIPARDGVARGQIKRSNKFPNCSFFHNWVNPRDTIVWTAQVAASGRYRVEMEYACPKQDVGSTFELSFNGSKLRGKITEAHDPPLRGQENDRHKRIESYVKDFKTMDLGVIELEKGKGELTLRALDMPGSQVMEFRLLMLTRVE